MLPQSSTSTGYFSNSTGSSVTNCRFSPINRLSICPKISLITVHERLETPLKYGTLRATSHTSQEPWPCNGEDPWLSTKGRTMGVGKVILGVHGPSSIVWSENGPCCGTIAYFVGGKRGEDLVSYNMSQTLPIRENYLVVFINIILHGLYSKIRLEIRPGICPTDREKKNLKNSWSPGICVRPTSWR